MSNQSLDLRRIATIVRRHKLIMLIAAVVGLGLGVGFTMLNPPMLASQALVVVPQSTLRTIETQVVVVTSEPVLTRAMHRMHPPMPLAALRRGVSAKNLTYDLLAVIGHARTARQARSIATAVAQSYVRYVGTTSSAVGLVQAHTLETAGPATGTPVVVSLSLTAGVGLLIGMLFGVIAAVAIGRGDRRLRTRDEIADAIGIPVLASLAAGRPSDAGAWVMLLDGYQPSPAEAWSLRSALHQLRLANDGSGFGITVAVVSIASDAEALAIGPQLATFAASLGIPTTLLVGLQQDVTAAAALRAACAAPQPPGSRRMKLTIAARDRGTADWLTRAALTVLVITVDGRAPQITDAMPVSGAVIAVSAGRATAGELARLAACAAADGKEITGIVVANPDPEDETTGRNPVLARMHHGQQPMRMTGLTLENR